MRILSFDTTNNSVSIALLDCEKIVSQRLFRATGSERQESVTLLLPAVDEMLEEARWKKSDLQLLVVGIGPGSFTGIRIGVVTARTLAQALNLPLVGVSLLDSYAAMLLESSPDLAEFAVVLSGGRGHFYFAAYRNGLCQPEQEVSEQTRIIEVVKAQHGNLPEMNAALACNKTWAVETPLVEALAGEAKSTDRNLVELPLLANIAAFQGGLALKRISDSKSSCSNSLASLAVSEENERDHNHLKESLLVEYPYRLVEPLYLRGASVTLKGNDGKATATN